LTTNPAFTKIIEDETPLHRLGKPEEVARKIPVGWSLDRVVDFVDAVAFLSSKKSAYITGHVLNIDGGMSIKGFNLFPAAE